MSRLLRSGMIFLVFFDAMIAAEIDLATFKLDGLLLIYRLAGNRASCIDLDGVLFFLRHLCDDGFGILIEFVYASFAAEIDELAFVFCAVLFDDRAAADRAEFVGDGFLLSAVRDARRDSACNHHQCKKSNGYPTHKISLHSLTGLVRLRGSRTLIIPIACSSRKAKVPSVEIYLQHAVLRLRVVDDRHNIALFQFSGGDRLVIARFVRKQAQQVGV